MEGDKNMNGKGNMLSEAKSRLTGRKLYLFDLITLDGYFEGPNQDISWHNVDREFNEFAIQQLNEIGTLLFGRVTYQLMASYWPTETALKDDPVVAEKMNSLPKVVFSRTLEKAGWNNTRLFKDDIVSKVAELKQHSEKDIAVFGSSNLSLTLIKHKLIDEFRIMVNPILLGNGIPLFRGISERLSLKLLKTKTFKSGNILLYYERH
jgi:dihydrofolate reductase